MLRSSLCDYSGAYILVKGNISVNNTAAEGTAANNGIQIDNAQIDNAEYIDILMLMHNLI